MLADECHSHATRPKKQEIHSNVTSQPRFYTACKPRHATSTADRRNFSGRRKQKYCKYKLQEQRGTLSKGKRRLSDATHITNVPQLFHNDISMLPILLKRKPCALRWFTASALLKWGKCGGIIYNLLLVICSITKSYFQGPSPMKRILSISCDSLV